MFNRGSLVHSALYKFGVVKDIFEVKANSLGYLIWHKVERYEISNAKNVRLVIEWNKKTSKESYYDGEGYTLRDERTYPSLQLVNTKLNLPEKYLSGELMDEEEITEDIKVVEKWQTNQMDEYFKIPKKS